MYEIDKRTNEPIADAQGRIKAKTSHTLNPVPLHIFAPGAQLESASAKSRATGNRGAAAPGLANLAGTVLYLMGYEAPEDFEPGLIRSA